MNQDLYSPMIRVQQAFLLDVALLIRRADVLGFVVTGGELWRPQEMQDLYFKQGLSKTKYSQHQNRLAIDLNIFKEGKLCNREQALPLGNYWESLNEKNRWGGSWRGQVEEALSKKQKPFIDTPHFERMK